MFKIALAADLHIPFSGELLRDIDARSRFRKVINQIVDYKPDLFIVAGDIAGETGNAEIYNWVKKVLDDLPVLKCYLSGNHDNTELMKSIFEISYSLSDTELFYYRDIPFYRLAFLDTSSGFVSEKQLDWLKKLNDISESDIILFSHYPLNYCGCRHMDKKYPLKNIPEVKDLIKECPRIKYIFAGHYHIDKLTEIHHARQYLTPSTAFQIYPEPENSVMDMKNYGWRTIEIEEKKVYTEVKYIKEEGN